MPLTRRNLGMRRNQTRRVRRSGGVRSTVRKAVVAAKRKTFNQRVRRVLNRVSETKYVANQYASGASESSPGVINNLPMPYTVNANLGTVNQYLPAIPAVTLGDDDWQRDGSVVQPVGLRAKLNFYFQQKLDAETGAVISDNPGQFVVKVFYGVGRKQKIWGSTETPIVSAGDLLEKGDGTTQGANGNLNELMYPINKKSYVAKAKTFIMGKSEGVITANSGDPATTGGYSTSAGTTFKSITLKFSPPKKLQYEDENAVFPNNYAPWFAVIAYPLNQYSTTFTNPPTRPIPITMVSECQMWYKDM
jgi:hypothetical protein